MEDVFSTQPYKGTRDFYPEDMKKRCYVFDTWRRVMTSMGFEQYDSSIIENADIYLVKSGEELGGSQLYSFMDKGDRKIAIRPEMTPSLARLVSAKFEQLRFPLRWFSIPNVFRYERPQKGRLREHWQLNADIIGIESGESEIELLTAATKLFAEFGATKEHFKIMVNHRKLIDQWLNIYSISDKKTVYKVLDDWYKHSPDENALVLSQHLTPLQVDNIFSLASKSGKEWEDYYSLAFTFPEMKFLLEIFKHTHPEIDFEFNPTIIRGIAYYTGTVFEAFDKNPDNPRSLMGGGRYDNLLDLFGKKSPAVGFGLGDVTWEEFLNSWNLWPQSLIEINSDKVGIMPFSQDDMRFVYETVIPDLQSKNQIFDINYEYQRTENKRWETLKKRGCGRIIKIQNGTIM